VGVRGRIGRDDAVAVDGYAVDRRAGRLEGVDGSLVARVLHRARGAGAEEQPGRDVDSLLDAADDDDAAGVGNDAARGRKVVGDRRPQRHQACGIGVLRQADGPSVRQGCLQQTPPRLDRKQAGARPPRKEIER